MADLIVIVPARERPQAVAELAEAFDETCRTDAELMFVVDESDPTKPAYFDAIASVGGRVDIMVTASRNMMEALNMSAVPIADAMPFAVGFMGDDHRPRTVGWDDAYLHALREFGTGMVYGNDLLQGERIPTQIAMTSDIVRTLGHMGPPTLIHMYLDDYWKELGSRAGCIRYLPNIVVEHMHPAAGKAVSDAGYVRVNAQSVFDQDKAAYVRWKAMELPREVAKVKALRTGKLATGGVIQNPYIVGERGPEPLVLNEAASVVAP